jgi:hypothetical protein
MRHIFRKQVSGATACRTTAALEMQSTASYAAPLARLRLMHENA